MAQRNINESWNKADIDAKSDPITQDPGGETRIVRQFWFTFNPTVVDKINRKELEPPSRQGLFNAHAKQIEIMLWGDGLVFDTEFEPRIVISKKRYKIIIVCKARQGVMIGQDNKVHNIVDLLNSSV